MENDNWKKQAVSYSENIILGNSLRTYYDNKKEIVYCESSSKERGELLKGLKRLYSRDLTPNKGNRKNNNKRYKGNKPHKKQNETKKKS